MTENTASRENGRCRPRGYAAYRPQQKTRALLGQVYQVLEEYRDHLPLTVRQVFYRLVGQYGYEKTENAYDRLAEALVRARRAKMIPFDMIRDDGIVTIGQTFYGGIEDFHDETAARARGYRRDRQTGQDEYIELWCESAGMLHQLHRVADPYSIPVYSAGGFGSLTGNYEIARRALTRDVPTAILHVGDYDPSGESIFTAMTEDAAAFVRADRTIWTQQLYGVRVALTEDQVREYDLPTAPPKTTDKRSKSWKGETCQLEALAPDVLARIVVEEIEVALDSDIYQEQIERERGERAQVLGLPAGDKPSDGG